MPFIHYADSHRCELPNARDNGHPLFIGDVWQCDAIMPETNTVCGKYYRWTNSQRDGNYWGRILGGVTGGNLRDTPEDQQPAPPEILGRPDRN